MDRTTPPISIHIALSVGAPVKKRAMSELNDLFTMCFRSMTPPWFAYLYTLQSKAAREDLEGGR
jgi:hypothetical protein